eukprot:gene9363-12614_t
MSSNTLANKRWMSDSESDYCSNCNDQFTLISRKHHCRCCGRLLCGICSSTWLLIPKDKIISGPHNKTDSYDTPQRTCVNCSKILMPFQDELRMNSSPANSDIVLERSTNERYLNLPITLSLESDIKKAAYTLYNFTADNKIEGIDRIPRELILGAKGIAFFTILKAGFLFTGRLGTGLVVSRLEDGSWSAPSALMMSGMGWGFQIGGELTDVILILTSTSAINAFSSNAQISVGTELGVSVGPVGRSAGTDLHAGKKGASAAFSYAHSKGLFVGISLEASIIASRPDVNRSFYGMEVKPADLLSGVHPRPKAAEPLYKALSEVLTNIDDDDINRTTIVSRFTSITESILHHDSSSKSKPNNNSTLNQIIPNNSSNEFSDAWTFERNERIKQSMEKENALFENIRSQSRTTSSVDSNNKAILERDLLTTFNTSDTTNTMMDYSPFEMKEMKSMNNKSEAKVDDKNYPRMSLNQKLSNKNNVIMEEEKSNSFNDIDFDINSFVEENSNYEEIRF